MLNYYYYAAATAATVTATNSNIAFNFCLTVQFFWGYSRLDLVHQKVH